MWCTARICFHWPSLLTSMTVKGQGCSPWWMASIYVFGCKIRTNLQDKNTHTIFWKVAWLTSQYSMWYQLYTILIVMSNVYTWSSIYRSFSHQYFTIIIMINWNGDMEPYKTGVNSNQSFAIVRFDDDSVFTFYS